MMSGNQEQNPVPNQRFPANKRGAASNRRGAGRGAGNNMMRPQNNLQQQTMNQGPSRFQATQQVINHTLGPMPRQTQPNRNPVCPPLVNSSNSPRLQVPQTSEPPPLTSTNQAQNVINSLSQMSSFNNNTPTGRGSGKTGRGSRGKQIFGSLFLYQRFILSYLLRRCWGKRRPR